MRKAQEVHSNEIMAYLLDGATGDKAAWRALETQERAEKRDYAIDILERMKQVGIVLTVRSHAKLLQAVHELITQPAAPAYELKGMEAQEAQEDIEESEEEYGR